MRSYNDTSDKNNPLLYLELTLPEVEAIRKELNIIWSTPDEVLEFSNHTKDFLRAAFTGIKPERLKKTEIEYEKFNTLS